MNHTLDSGYLVLADISGYTSYVASTELDHAHAILGELLELIVERFHPLLQLSKLEGDAVFAYAPSASVTRSESVLEMIESTYVVFRDRVENIRRRTSCTCNACRAIPTLDLKFIVHYGEYALQSVGNMSELAGQEVTLLHRLGKNRVTEETGWRAYSLFTEVALQQLGVELDELHSQVEEYEHLGEVTVYALDLHKRYKILTDERRVQVAPEEAYLNFVVDYAAPPPTVWEWLNDPLRRNEWMPHATWSAAVRPGGRTGIGARNHCAHGKGENTIEVILDWRPFDYFTVAFAGPFSSRLIVTEYLEAKDRTKTQLRVAAKVEHRLLPEPIKRMLCKMMMKNLIHGLENMGRYVSDSKEPAICIMLPQLART